MDKKLMVGRQALQKLGSSLYSEDVHYLINNTSTDDAYVTDHQRNTLYLNAYGDPLFREVWEMEIKNMGPFASPQALLELTAYDFVKHYHSGFWQKTNEDEFSIKFLVRTYNLEGIRVVNKYLEPSELARVEKIISSMRK